MGLNETSTGILKGLVVIAAVFVVLAGLKTATNILVPFLLSVFIAIFVTRLLLRLANIRSLKVFQY